MKEKTLGSRTVYRGRIVTLELVDVEMEDGTRTVREIVRHRGAAVVLARTETGEYLLVRQFRKPVERELLEAVAGTLDPGEAPETCARRELQEETGYKATSLRHLGTVYPSPGYIEERMEIFFAEAVKGQGGTSLDHDEHITPQVLSRREVEDGIRSGAIVDAKTLAAWLLYEKLMPHHEAAAEDD